MVLIEQTLVPTLNFPRPWTPTEEWFEANGMKEGSGCFRTQYKLENMFNLFEYYKEKYLIATSTYELCEITVKRKNTSSIREKLSWDTDLHILIDRCDIRYE